MFESVRFQALEKDVLELNKRMAHLEFCLGETNSIVIPDTNDIVWLFKVRDALQVLVDLKFDAKFNQGQLEYINSKIAVIGGLK